MNRRISIIIIVFFLLYQIIFIFASFLINRDSFELFSLCGSSRTITNHWDIIKEEAGWIIIEYLASIRDVLPKTWRCRRSPVLPPLILLVRFCFGSLFLMVREKRLRSVNIFFLHVLFWSRGEASRIHRIDWWFSLIVYSICDDYREQKIPGISCQDVEGPETNQSKWHIFVP